MSSLYRMDKFGAAQTSTATTDHASSNADFELSPGARAATVPFAESTGISARATKTDYSTFSAFEKTFKTAAKRYPGGASPFAATSAATPTVAAAAAPFSSLAASVASRKRPLRCGNLLFTGAFDSGNMESVDLVHLEDPTTGLRSEVYRIRVNSDSPCCDYRMRYYLGICHASDAAGADSFGTVHTGLGLGSTASNYIGSINLEIVNLNPMLKCYTRNLAPLVCRFRSGTHDLNMDPAVSSWTRLGLSEYQTFSFCSNLHIKLRLDVAAGHTCMITSHYPHSYASCQMMLNQLELKYPASVLTASSSSSSSTTTNTSTPIYLRRELLVRSLEGARVDLLTVTSNKGRSAEREALPLSAWRPGMSAKHVGVLFPERADPRPYRFPQKRIIFLSGRVHPGETPGSHVLNGLIKFLVDDVDPRAALLRDKFVFKIVPMLNPDGVRRGNFRCDSRGVNLNRMYLNPSQELHPSIFALKEMVRACSLHKLVDPNAPLSSKKRSSTYKGNRKSTNKWSRKKSADGETSDGQSTPHFFGTADRALIAFIDFHSMSMRPGAYSMANGSSAVSGKRGHLMDSLNHVFAKLCEVCSPHFNYTACTFGGGGGRRKKRRKASSSSLSSLGGGGGDAESTLALDLQAALLAHNKGAHRKEDAEAVADWRRIKEEAGRGNPEGNKGGAGRVCIAKEFGVVHAYTIEASCNVSQASAERMAGGPSYNLSNLGSLCYLPGHHGEVGKAIGLALLEMNGSVPKKLSCLHDTRFESIHDMVYAFRTQKHPVTHKRRSSSGSGVGAGAGSNPRVAIQHQIRAQKLLLEQMQITRANGSKKGASSLTVAVATGAGRAVDSKGAEREDEIARKDKSSHDHVDDISSAKRYTYQRSSKSKTVNIRNNKRSTGSSSAEPLPGRESSKVAMSSRKPTPPLDVNFHSVSQDPNWGARYRMLAGPPKAVSSGGGFLRKKISSGKPGSESGSSRRQRSRNKARGHTQKSSPIPGPSSSSSLRWGNGGSLAAQLAQARASILEERSSLGLEDSMMGSLTDLGERSYRFDKRAGDETSSGRLIKKSSEKSSGNNSSSSSSGDRGGGSEKKEKRRRRRNINVREGAEACMPGSRGMGLREAGTSSTMRTTVSANSLFNQKERRQDRGNPLRSRRRRKGRPQKVSSGASGVGGTSPAKVPGAPIPQKTARFLSPLLGSHTAPRIQLEEQ